MASFKNDNKKSAPIFLNVIGQPEMLNKIIELHQNKDNWYYTASIFITIFNINRY